MASQTRLSALMAEIAAEDTAMATMQMSEPMKQPIFSIQRWQKFIVSQAVKHNMFKSWTWKSFLFIALYHSLHISLFAYGWNKIAKETPLPGFDPIKYPALIARSAALPLSLDLMLLLLPMCKITITQLRLLIKWIPVEEATWFHRQVAYTMLFFTTVHTAAHYVNFYLVEKDNIRPDKAMAIHYTQAAGITGHIMLLCMVLIYAFAHAKIRAQAFEAFQWTHRLSPIFLIAAWAHGSGCWVRNSPQAYSIIDGKQYWAHCVGAQAWRWEAWFSGLYILERTYSLLWGQKKVNVSKVLQHPSNVLELRFDRVGTQYKAGQWLFIKCPALSKSQWHPFSISSCPNDPYISVHIRQVGDFTKGLRDVFDEQMHPAYDVVDEADPYLAGAAQPTIIHSRVQLRENPSIVIEGPYGAPAEDLFGNEVAVLIGAGIGVTPWASVLKTLWHLRSPRQKREGHMLRRVEFIWVCKDLREFEWFQNLITSLNTQSASLPSSDSSIRLICHTYLTRPDTAALNMYRETLQRRSSISSFANPRPRLARVSEGLQKKRVGQQHSHIHTGRPKFPEIFRDIRESLMPAERRRVIGRRMQIGVNFCGPKGMANDIRSACASNTTGEVRFRFKKETF